METDNRCVACGEIIPEGRQICLNCEHSIPTDIPGLVFCQLDNRSKDDDMVCKKYERNLKRPISTKWKKVI